MRLESRLEGRDELPKLVERQTRQIQELCGAGLHVGELYTGHPWCLLSWEAQYIINRDNLSRIEATNNHNDQCLQDEAVRIRFGSSAWSFDWSRRPREVVNE